MAISNFDFVIQNVILKFAWIHFCILLFGFCLLYDLASAPSGFLSFAFCNYLALISCGFLYPVFCILNFFFLDSMLALLAFCNYSASIPCLFSVFWILRSAGCFFYSTHLCLSSVSTMFFWCLVSKSPIMGTRWSGTLGSLILWKGLRKVGNAIGKIGN